MLDFNLNYYKTFLVCGRCLNITEAAQQLYTSQPAVTRAIRQLEEQLHCLLFVRTHAGLVLTMEGELLYEALSHGFEQIEAAENRIQTVREGGVRVGVNNLASEWIARQISEIMEARFPQLSVMIISLDIQDFENALLSHSIDLALDMRFYGIDPKKKAEGPSHGYSSAKIQERALGRFPDVFLVGPAYQSLADRELSLRELAELPLITLLTPSPSSQYYLSVLRGGAVEETDYLVNGPEHRISLAEWNHGLTVFPAYFVQKKLQEGKLFQLQNELPMCSCTLTVAKDISSPQSVPSIEFEQLLFQPIF